MAAAGGSNTAGELISSTFGYETQLQKQLRVDQVCALLRENHMDMSTFTVHNINSLGHNVDDFIKEVRFISTSGDAALLRTLWNQGAAARVVNDIQDGNVQKVIKFCSWIKSKPGQEAMRKVYLARKTETKVTPQLTAEDITWGLLLRAMHSDFSSDVKTIRNEYQEKIIEHQRQIRLLERAREEAIDELVDLFKPASAFVEPPPERLQSEAYAMFLPMNDMGLKAVELYGNEIRQLAAVEFCRTEEVRGGLKSYLEMKILSLDEVGDTKQAGTFRNYYAALGGTEIIQDATDQEEEEDEADPVGSAGTDGGSDVPPATGGSGDPPHKRSQSLIQTRLRTHNRRKSRISVQSKGKSVAAVDGGEEPGHSSGPEQV